MRKIITLLALLPLFTTAQTWAPVGATWSYTQGSCCGPDSTVAVVEVVGDTLIGGHLCRNLQMTSGWQLCYALPHFQYQSNDSLFYWNEASGTFELLFRWDAVPGDTWSTAVGYDVPVDTLDWTVLDTGSISLGSVSLKQWTVQQEGRHGAFFSPISMVTERLGPATSPFTWVSGVCDAETYQGMRCYEDTDISWLNPQYPQCGSGTQGPVVPVGATWNYNGMRWEHWGGSEVMVLAPFVGQVECTGTEVVQGRSCSVLAPSDPIAPTWDWCNYVPTYLTRSNDTVYYWNGLDSAFHTLYVLNTPIGGSWTSPNPFDPQADWYDVTWTVLDTGTILVDGIALRQLVVVSDEGILDTLTERMGFHQFPAPWNWGMWGGCDIGDLDGLRCYADDEISWMAPGYTECWPQDPAADITQFDDPSNSWYVAHTFPAGSPQDPGFVATRTTRYFYNGTVSAEGVTWKSLYAEPTWEDNPMATLHGYVHQYGGVVWFRDTLGTISTLYNFNLQVGDSVLNPWFGLESPYLTIEAIDTVMIQDHPHRRFRFSVDWVIMEANYSDVWIEGIGSRSGPLAPRIAGALLTGSSGYPDSTRTTCFLQGPDLQWQHPGYPSCTMNILLGLDEADASVPSLYPNPARDMVYVKGLPLGQWPYRLTDVLGRIHAEGQLSATGSPTAITLEGLATGPYLLHVLLPGPKVFRLFKQ